MAAGGWSGTARHIVQEALRLPATKLYKAGTLNPEVRDLIEHNVRFSRQWWGDVQAQIASNITAERRVRGTDPKERIGRGPESLQRRYRLLASALPQRDGGDAERECDARATSTWRTTVLATAPTGCRLL